MKFDIVTKQRLHWEEEHCWPAEPVFVPSPNAKEEDDGKRYEGPGELGKNLGLH